MFDFQDLFYLSLDFYWNRIILLYVRFCLLESFFCYFC